MNKRHSNVTCKLRAVRRVDGDSSPTSWSPSAPDSERISQASASIHNAHALARLGASNSSSKSGCAIKSLYGASRGQGDWSRWIVVEGGCRARGALRSRLRPEVALLSSAHGGLRKVYPYYFTFTTFTKGRWVGERILDVFAREFRAHPAEEYERCIRAGTLTVNYEKVDVDYRLKHNDLLANVVHSKCSVDELSIPGCESCLACMALGGGRLWWCRVLTVIRPLCPAQAFG
ncbi:Uncharacterized protein GBIM_10301 [Gryllus bimaculatus]|nr:Uncharacterized protein GBIM_10301 [Gryllus bimaculatus]